jgi:hypothetical protein
MVTDEPQTLTNNLDFQSDSKELAIALTVAIRMLNSFSTSFIKFIKKYPQLRELLENDSK